MIGVQKLLRQKTLSALCAVIFSGVFVGVFALGASPVYAAAPCLPGLPCDVPLTPDDDPFDGVIEPNQPGTPNAPKLGLSSYACDADFMNQIYAKAFLEAEREVVINNALMLKPDSVLEYSCFDQDAAAVALFAGPVFSESTRWAPTTINVLPGSVTINVNMGDTRLDTSIEQLVLESLKVYVDENFAHDFLGGAATGDNNTIANTVAGISTLPCDFMYLVQDVSRCDDFALNSRFMTFETYFSTPALINNDPRTLPETCPSGHQITQATINIAKNTDWTFAAFDRLDALLPFQRAGFPPAAGGNSCESAIPIPTGVITFYEEYGSDPAGNPITIEKYPYEDKVCSNPDCLFDTQGTTSDADDRCVP